MRTAPHPVFALAAVENRPVLFARIGLPDGRGLPELAAAAETTEVVPVHVASDRLVLVMASALGAEALERAGFTVDRREPVEDRAAFLIRDDRPVTESESLADSADTAGSATVAARRATAAYGFIADALAEGCPAGRPARARTGWCVSRRARRSAGRGGAPAGCQARTHGTPAAGPDAPLAARRGSVGRAHRRSGRKPAPGPASARRPATASCPPRRSPRCGRR